MELYTSRPRFELPDACEQLNGEEEKACQYSKSVGGGHAGGASACESVGNNEVGMEGQLLWDHRQRGSAGLEEWMAKEKKIRGERKEDREMEMKMEEDGKEERGGATSACTRIPELEEPWSSEEIQRRIRDISKNPNLSEAEKDRQRQAVLSQPFQQRRLREVLQFRDKMKAHMYKISHSKVVDPSTGDEMLGCEHYPRNCKIKAYCCQLWFVCRLCHDQPCMDHAIDRFRTEEVMCMMCKTVQKVRRDCIRCGEVFAHYFCEKCKFYDNTPGKDIYHCDKCTICRVGKGIGHDNFHCDRCGACVSIEHSKTHRCLKKSLDANCPICDQYLFTSTKPVVYMRCGHTMHLHCFDDYTAEHFTCPLCHKTLTDMHPYWSKVDELVKGEVMPPEYRNRVAEILCHDCGKRSETPHHFSYVKCMNPGCGSYNTTLLRWYQKDQSSAPSASGPSDESRQTGYGNSCGNNDNDDSNGSEEFNVDGQETEGSSPENG